MIKKIWGLIIAVLVLSAGSVHADALALRNYAEILVQNLQIGQTYSMINLVNLPLEIANNGDAPATVEINVFKPSPGKTKPGFEPIPDTSWITIAPKQVTIAAHAVYDTDVKISIPKDKALLGKKFHADLHVRTLPEGKSMMMIALAVQGRFLFTIAPVEQETTAPEKVNLNFSVKPGRIVLDQVPLGRAVAVKAEKGHPVTIKNSSAEELTIFVKSLDPRQTITRIEEGYQACPDPNFITCPQGELQLKGKSEKALELKLRIPDQPAYRGKHYQFIVAVSTGEQTSGIRYVPILVNTAP